MSIISDGLVWKGNVARNLARVRADCIDVKWASLGEDTLYLWLACSHYMDWKKKRFPQNYGKWGSEITKSSKQSGLNFTFLKKWHGVKFYSGCWKSGSLYRSCTDHDDVIKWKHFPRYWPFVRGEFPTQRPVTLSFDVYFDLRLNKRLSKQSQGWWFETLLCPLWLHSNDPESYHDANIVFNDDTECCRYGNFRYRVAWTNAATS